MVPIAIGLALVVYVYCNPNLANEPERPKFFSLWLTSGALLGGAAGSFFGSPIKGGFCGIFLQFLTFTALVPTPFHIC
jgi:hypothetical protein